MTPAQLRTERDYRIQERLGMLCGAEKPTREQLAIAHAEADEWEARVMGIATPKDYLKKDIDNQV